MIYALTLLFVIALFVFDYRYLRNGIPWKCGNFLSRLFWGIGFSIGYVVLAAPVVNWIVAAMFVPLVYLSMLVPHAWVQNMGRWAVIQKKWPGFFLPDNWPSKWVPGSFTATLHDFVGMMAVGFFRGLIIFVPTIFAGVPVAAIGVGVASNTLAEAFAYLVGRFTPFNAFDNAAGFWGEWWVGTFKAFVVAAFVAAVAIST